MAKRAELLAVGNNSVSDLSSPSVCAVPFFSNCVSLSFQREVYVLPSGDSPYATSLAGSEYEEGCNIEAW